MIDRFLVVSLLGYLGAGAWIAHEWQRPPPDTTVNGPVKAEVIQPLELPERFTPERQTFSEITERPLFVMGRRPITEQTEVIVQPKVVPQQTLPDILDSVRLTAVMRVGEDRTALIETPNGETTVLDTGDAVGEWRLTRIDDASIELMRGAQRRVLQVHQFGPPPAAPPAAPVQAPKSVPGPRDRAAQEPAPQRRLVAPPPGAVPLPQLPGGGAR
jgi:Tfp pilus assembly protein PilP